MNEPSREIELSFAFTFLDRLRAAFLLIPQRRLGIVLAAIFPLIGLSVLAFAFATGREGTVEVWVILVLCLLFHPAMVVTGVAAAHFGNKHVREPFTYSFNDSGIHVSAATYEYTHRWPAISRVEQIGGYLMFFFSPGCAHCIPVEAARSAGVLEPLVAMARAHGVNAKES